MLLQSLENRLTDIGLSYSTTRDETRLKLDEQRVEYRQGLSTLFESNKKTRNNFKDLHASISRFANILFHYYEKILSYIIFIL
jgi:hypothetical protein